MLTVTVTITGRFICSVISHCDNKGGRQYAVLAVIVTIMTAKGRYMRSVSSYCDNNEEVYVQC